MNIRLREGGRLLDLKLGFKLNLTISNPMLAESSSMSLPITIPETPDNNRQLGLLNLQSLHKPKRNHDVTIEAGVYQKPALLRINEKLKDREAVLYLNESPMYAKMKEVELSQAFNIIRPTEDFHVDGTFDTPLDMVIKYMELVMMDNINEDFFLFPVATDYYTEMVHTSFGDKEYTFFQVLNEQMSSEGGSDDTYDTDLYGNRYRKLAGRRARQYREGGEWVDVPKGYGITPFLKQTFILHRIFNYFGYKLEESIFDTDPEFRKIVFMNNTSDAIVETKVDGVVKTRLNYAQLIPSGTIKDFLDAIRIDYGCDFSISTDFKTVKVIFWNDLLPNIDYRLLDSKLSGKYKLELSDELLLKLTGKRSIEYSEMNFDTQEKFEKNYGVLKYIKYLDSRDYTHYADGYYLVQSLGDIYERYTYINNSGNPVQGWRYNSKYLFDYYREKEAGNYEDKASNREYVAAIPAYVHYTEPLVGARIPGTYYRMPFIGKRRNLNTFVRKLYTDENGNVESVDEKEDTVTCPIMSAFYRGRATDLARDQGRVYGNITMYDDLGEPFEGGFNLIFGGTTGLYDKFWKIYAAAIRDSFHKVTIPLHFDISDILSFRFDNIYMIDNQPLLAEKLAFSIDRDDNVTVSEAVFRTIKLYLDA
jgi:hypothetical protein